MKICGSRESEDISSGMGENLSCHTKVRRKGVLYPAHVLNVMGGVFSEDRREGFTRRVGIVL